MASRSLAAQESRSEQEIRQAQHTGIDLTLASCSTDVSYIDAGTRSLKDSGRTIGCQDTLCGLKHVDIVPEAACEYKQQHLTYD